MPSRLSAAGLGPVVTALRTLGYRAKIVVYNGTDYFEHVADSRYKIQGGILRLGRR